MDNLQDQFHAPLIELYVCGVWIFLRRKRKLGIMQKHLYHSSGWKYLHDVCGNIISGNEIISLSFKRLSPSFKRFGMQMLSRVGHTLALKQSKCLSPTVAISHQSLLARGLLNNPNVQYRENKVSWAVVGSHSLWGIAAPDFQIFVGIPFFLHKHCSQEPHPLVLHLISLPAHLSKVRASQPPA